MTWEILYAGQNCTSHLRLLILATEAYIQNGTMAGWVGCLHAPGRNFCPTAFKFFLEKFKYPERTDGIVNGMSSHFASLSWGLFVKNKEMLIKTEQMYGSLPNLANV